MSATECIYIKFQTKGGYAAIMVCFIKYYSNFTFAHGVKSMEKMAIAQKYFHHSKNGNQWHLVNIFLKW